MLDVLCVGDSVIDIFLKIPTSDPRFKLDKEKKELLVKYGEKISVEKYVIGIGGNATNTGVGLARLGSNTGLCAEIGNDEFSKKIVSTLEKEKIDTSYLSIDSDRETSLTVALSYDGDRTLLTEHVKRDHDFSFENLQTRMIYLSSLGQIWEKAYEKVLEIVKNKKIKLSFNPGVLQIEKRDKLIMDIIEHADYLFLNKEEAEVVLYGKELEIEGDNLMKKLLFGLKSLGAKNVIITDSNNGSFCQDENGELFHLAALKVEALEKTGAGDGFNAGFIAAILKDENTKDALLWGSLNASSVVQKIGAEEGLLNLEEMNEKIKKLNNPPFEEFT